MQINVSVTDANNIVCEVVPPQPQVIVIDRGVEGNGIVSIVPVTISTFQYLRITYTNGTVQDVGPLTSTAYTATSPITIVGNTISLATVPIASGGTDATTAAGAIQNLLPSYTGNANKRLGLNSGGTALEWVADGGGTVTSINASGGTTGLTFSGGPITSSGTLTLSGTLAIANGGTGQITANAAFNALAPSQTGNAGKYLTTDGTDTSWATNPLGTVTSVAATVPSFLSVTGSPITTSGTLAITYSGTALPIANGGTGQTTANAALNALLPTQTGNASKYLQTDGTNATWDAISLSTADITGILPTTNGGTGLSSFTANGVVYASSTSALTTGSALTFDGTNLGVGGIYSGYGANYPTIQAKGTYGGIFRSSDGTGTTVSLFYSSSGNYLTLGTETNYPIQFIVNNSEAMRLTSTGLGIGTSSPIVKLQVYDAGNTYSGSFGSVGGSQIVALGNSAGIATIQGFSNSSFSAYSDLALQSGGGNVGVGTSSPFAKLSITTANGNFGIANGNTSGGTKIQSFGTTTSSDGYLAFEGYTKEYGRFDSAGNFGIGTSSPSYKLDVLGSARLKTGATGTPVIVSTGSDTQGTLRFGSASAEYSINGGADYLGLIFNVNGSEGMRLTSTGLGIGTSSPQARLNVVDASSPNNGTIWLGSATYYGTVKHNATGTGANEYNVASASGGGHLFQRGGSTQLTLDTSGNLGLGVTPSAWNSVGLKGFQIGGVALTQDDTIFRARLFTNVGVAGGSFSYLQNNYALQYLQRADTGEHSWYVAGSGTAGNAITFTQAMTLDASGNLVVGGTSANVYGASKAITLNAASGQSCVYEYTVAGTSTGYFGGSSTATWIGSKANIPLVMYTNDTERARIDSSGNFGIGTSSPSYKLTIAQSGSVNNQYISLQDNQTGGHTWNIANNAGNNLGAFGLYDVTAGAYRLILDASGNLGLGVTPSAWGFGGNLELPATNNISFQGAYGNINSNAYYDLSQTRWEYITSGYAAQYQIGSAGQHIWNTAGSGTAGNAISFTQAMTLDASGQLFLGRTSQVNDGQFSIQTTGSNNSLITTPWADTKFLSKMYFSSAYYLGVRADAANRELALMANSDDATARIAFYTGNAGTATERARIDSSGNLLVGATTSSGLLTLKNNPSGSSENVLIAIQQNGGGTSTLGKLSYQQSDDTMRLYNASSYSASALIFGTSNTERARIDSSGNLAIGTTTPDIFGRFYTRSVGFSSSGSTVLQVNGGSGSYGAIDFGAGGTRYASVVGSANELQIATNAATPILLVTNNVEKARIDSSGNLLVGTTSAQTGVASDAVGITLYGQTATGVGVFTRASSYPLYVNNKAANGGLIQFYNNGNSVGTITSDGTSAAYNTSSDYRLKNSIAPMTGALAKVALLKPVTYKWNSNGSDGEGFIAHELAEVVPQAVTGEKDAVDEEGNPKYQGIDTSFLVATLTAAIQEQQTIIESLKARLDAANL